MDILTVFSIIGFLLTVLGVYLGILPIKFQKPVYIKDNAIVIDITTNPDANLKITYQNEPVQLLSSTNITFWNAGNLQIKQTDIPETTPLLIKSKPGIRIFNVYGYPNCKKENNVRFLPIPGPFPLEPDKVVFPITFEYLSKNEGAKIQVKHSGRSADDVEFIGKTKEYGVFEDISNQDRSQNKIGSAIMVIGVFFISGLDIYLGILFANLLTDIFHWANSVSFTIIVYVFMFIMLFLLIVSFANIINLILRYKYPEIPDYLLK